MHKITSIFLVKLSLVLLITFFCFLNERLIAQQSNQFSDDLSLYGTSWKLVEIESMSDEVGTLNIENSSSYIMDLWPDGNVTMQLNCKFVNGNWQAKTAADGKSGTFEFSPLAATLPSCPPPAYDERFLSQAEFVRGFIIKDDQLYLSLMADGGIYRWEFTGSLIRTPEEGGPQNWIIPSETDLLKEPDASAPVVMTYTEGMILDNLGCQELSSDIWCDAQELGGGPRGFVQANNLRPAISPDGSIFKGPDHSAMRAGKDDFDASGTVACSFNSDKPMGKCNYGVSRSGGGYATVAILKPDGNKRFIYFQMGIPIGANTSQANGYPSLKTEIKEDRHIILLNNETYEIPGAVVLGG
ncbi:META domain-containing protein [Rhodohalobacter sulfatireducens]|uniref:META domain-containing protein n=1 Tax=Rhodohalobacter sulfatireducens TaxID=2911366 RepID=A0ABS9KJ68_9BACT|nr:META domain-containing protein [Rhodohalobacter sulfatireducens]MCG2590893.1 META domain-containing protein [Rhodohalobacter sulfatireducens]